VNPLNFEEDSFDLDEHKKAADMLVQDKIRLKSVSRKIKFGKALLAIAALIIAVALYYVLATFIPLY